MADRLRLNFLENAHIVLDVGLTYTKIGYNQRTDLEIIQTPLSMIHCLHNTAEWSNYTY